MTSKMAAAGPLVDAARTVLEAEPGEWPDDVELYHPSKVNMLLTDCASCRSVEAYLQFCGLSYDRRVRTNTEFMSPTGKVPFLRVGKDLVAELSNIVSLVQAKGLGASSNLEPCQRAEMKAYMSLIETCLVPAELYILWWNKDFAARSRSQYGSHFPVPINKILSYKKQWEIGQHLRAQGWHLKSEREFWGGSREALAQFQTELIIVEIKTSFIQAAAGILTSDKLSYWYQYLGGKNAAMQSFPNCLTTSNDRMALEEIKKVFQALSEKLGSRSYFICDRPTELDALVFGHLHSILMRYQPDDSIVSLVKAHKNLEEYVYRILAKHFKA